jgi:hypothetical protein
MSFIVHRVAKHAARYTDAGGREKCGMCRFMTGPRFCGKVIGPVSPMGWCKYFSRQMVSQFGGSIVTSGIPAGATLALDFMSSGNMPPGITFTRASTATYIDAAGTMQTAAVNAPRWDYAGGSLRGLLIEEARTNLLLNSATLGTQSVAVTAQAYTLSFYGAGTVTKSGAATGALVGTGAGQRVTQPFTPTAGTLTCTVAGSVTNAQIEAGGWASSWISTAGAAATRAQDLCSISSANMAPWFNATGTWLAEFILVDPAPASDRIIGAPVTADGGAGPLLIGSGPYTLGQWDGSSFFATTNTVSVNVPQKAANASAGALGTAKLCLNGGPVASFLVNNGFASLATSGVRFLNTVAGVSADNGNGYIRRVQFWPRVLTDTEMQQVTT